ncbi:carbon monoxide dehydrogenase/acetyl-CoA synthase subunit alpha [Oxobacter pfennigii]|uniref:CO-methylating acetyl-CoA synthase n=1 Tax=Oxobacter pfennigii TaxID=36849 RepID=A0A0P8YWZ7_9CLOT|nr:acetyl-CoA decarbonylase/synthase complex subunit alpha/beta [Oxobacter pfennigii]KPU44252.1 carbon monoxide dehydrogenase/acetyl-CoA synthase subunit alpha [Oxobacter pfennigii]
MSTQLFKAAYDGAAAAIGVAESLLSKAIEENGGNATIEYPGTAYKLPVITALGSESVKTLNDIVPVINRVRSENLKEDLTLKGALSNGEVTLYAAEIIEALGYLNGKSPVTPPGAGFIPDTVLRALGVQLVDNTIPGVAVVLGKAKDSKSAAKLINELKSKGIVILLVDDIIDQLIEEGVNLGLESFTVPLGKFTQVIHAVNFALRGGLAFGGIAPGNKAAHLEYQQKRVMAFVIALGPLDEIRISAAFGAALLGFPTITDLPLEEGIPDWVISETDYEKIVPLALETRGIKLRITNIDVPIMVGPAFEGETIRKGDTYVEFGGGRTTAFELVKMVGPDEIEDGKITVHGPEIDEIEEGSKLPLGIKIKIYGRKMHQDFESVLERRVHYFINYGEGLWHVAQRDLCWLRISKDAKAKGFKIRHFGELLIAKFKSEYPALVDRVEVELYTDEKLVNEQIKEARGIYVKRDERLKGLTDESVEELYSCTLCQSFAPNHVCVVAPERVGLCGAVSWLDAKASYEITPTGPNRPIKKEGAIDEVKGIWKSVNDFVYNNSNHMLEEVSLYTLMENPMTSCGCFEAIIAMMPEVNGVMITSREHGGITPCGMSFSTLAGTVGGGTQSPGFMGIGRRYILSRKFLKADGGMARIVWMPKELKDYLREEFIKRSIEEGLGEDFINKIADESIGTSAEEIVPFLEEKGHPAMKMTPLF